MAAEAPDAAAEAGMEEKPLTDHDLVVAVAEKMNELIKKINDHEEVLKALVARISPSTAAPASGGNGGNGGDAAALLNFAQMARQVLMPSPPDPLTEFTHQLLPQMMGELMRDQLDLNKFIRQMLLRRAGMEVNEMVFKE